MLLRRVIKHVEEQNWTAISIDLVIVVAGVFIGIQVSNWNESLSAQARESRLLGELSAEIRQNSERSRIIGEGLITGADAARRVLTLAEQATSDCSPDCWSVIVDLMHASQWQRPNVRWTTYDELRRAGLPSDRRIIEAVERYQTIHNRASVALENPPGYRSLVRRLIPIDLQDRYWDVCFVETSGDERYVHPCAAPKDMMTIDAAIVRGVLDDPTLTMLLREWTSVARVTGNALVDGQRVAAQKAVDAINAATGG